MTCLAFGGLVLAWTCGAIAQSSPPEESYVPDLSQSYVQELGGPTAEREVMPRPLIAETAPQDQAWQNCQDYEQAVIANGQPRVAYGTACQGADGSWQLSSTPSLSSEHAYARNASGTCREFQQPDIIVGESRSAYGTACQQNGVWHFVAALQAPGQSGRYCRAYEQEIRDAEETITASGTACEEPDGSWRIVSAPAFGRSAYIAEDEPTREPRYTSRTFRADPAPVEAWEEVTPIYRDPPYVPTPRYYSAPRYETPRYEAPRYEAQARAPLSGFTEVSRAFERATSAIVHPFRSSSYDRPHSYGEHRYAPGRSERGHSHRYRRES